MSNYMFSKGTEVDGGVAVLDAPEGREVADEATMKARGEHMAPELDKPWTPVEDAEIEEIDALLDEFEEVGFESKKYRDAIKEMQGKWKEFKNRPSIESYKALSEIKAYVYEFDYRIKDRGPEFETKFFAKVDALLRGENIDRESLVKEVWRSVSEYAQKLREEKEVGTAGEKDKETKTDPPVEANKGFLGKMFGRMR